MRCLIVDDEPRICLGLKALLSWAELGFPDPDIAFSAEEALNKHRTTPYALILCDMRMPGRDGISLIRDIRAFDDDVSFLIISGYSDFEYARAALKYDVSDYILKPVDEDVLAEQIALVARRLGAIPFSGESTPQKARSIDISGVVRYVDQHFCEDVTLKEVAGIFYANQAYLGRMFHLNTGMKFSDYLNARRIEKAEKLLRDPLKRVTDICREVGYKDPVYFYKKFKEQTGKIPSDFRLNGTK